MSDARYLGPSDSLLLPDGKKAYHPGDTIPLSKAQKAALERSGHRFADTDVDAVVAAGMPAAPPDQRPRGDRGEVLEIADAHPEAVAERRTAAVAATTTAAPKTGE